MITRKVGEEFTRYYTTLFVPQCVVQLLLPADVFVKLLENHHENI